MTGTAADDSIVQECFKIRVTSMSPKAQRIHRNLYVLSECAGFWLCLTSLQDISLNGIKYPLLIPSITLDTYLIKIPYCEKHAESDLLKAYLRLAKHASSRGVRLLISCRKASPCHLSAALCTDLKRTSLPEGIGGAELRKEIREGQGVVV
ncbi:hypothetical protein RRG08_040333 [Elysia crispata]|uniref:Uncharacterized protein n=1 Tax=Elysia crispata TaxID=231223 RepID=A0AAE1AT05_9GAST|nr:hypothetical protein RRG08_040333 [Elysia crispata]